LAEPETPELGRVRDLDAELILARLGGRSRTDIAEALAHLGQAAWVESHATYHPAERFGSPGDSRER